MLDLPSMKHACLVLQRCVHFVVEINSGRAVLYVCFPTIQKLSFIVSVSFLSLRKKKLTRHCNTATHEVRVRYANDLV